MFKLAKVDINQSEMIFRLKTTKFSFRFVLLEFFFQRNFIFNEILCYEHNLLNEMTHKEHELYFALGWNELVFWSC